MKTFCPYLLILILLSCTPKSKTDRWIGVDMVDLPITFICNNSSQIPYAPVKDGADFFKLRIKFIEQKERDLITRTSILTGYELTLTRQGPKLIKDLYSKCAVNISKLITVTGTITFKDKDGFDVTASDFKESISIQEEAKKGYLMGFVGDMRTPGFPSLPGTMDITQELLARVDNISLTNLTISIE